MTDQVNSMEHANATNPCEGYCQSEDGICLACFRTEDERENWYRETNGWREATLVEIKKRKDNIFNG